MKIGKKMKLNTEADFLKNAGYTLLELIVVVAIMAVGLTIVAMSINTIFSLQMKQCVKDLNSELGKQKIAAMTRTGDVYMHLYKDGSGIFVDRYENDNLVEAHIKVGSAKVAVKYYSASNVSGTALDAKGIIIAFNKSNGSFKRIGEAWALLDEAYNPMYGGEYYTKLLVSGGKLSRAIILWPDTGKFSISG